MINWWHSCHSAEVLEEKYLSEITGNENAI